MRGLETNLLFKIFLTSFESSCEELGERIGVGAFNTRGPGLMRFVAEEDVAVVGGDGASETALVHLGTLKPKLDVVIFGNSDGGEVLRRSGGGHRERRRSLLTV